MWGVFNRDDDVQVVPVDEKGEPMAPHIFDTECLCHPELEEHDKLLVIHNQIN